MNEPQYVRIPRSKYNDLLKFAKMISKATDDPYEARNEIKFFQKNSYPTIQEMIDHDIENNVRKYLPYILFFTQSEAFDSTDKEFLEVREYINEIVEKYVILIEDEDYEKIENMTAATWKKIDFDKKAEILEPYMLYYDKNQFEDFLLDLGWEKFMTSYGYNKKNYKLHERNMEMEYELKKIWDKVFSFYSI